MIKKLMLFFLVGLSTSVFAQTPLVYEEVVKVDGISADDLFDRAEVWFYKTFKNPDYVILLKNKELGQIEGKASFERNEAISLITSLTNGKVSYKIFVYVKDGRYKLQMRDFYHTSNRYDGMGFVPSDSVYVDYFKGCPKQARQKAFLIVKNRILEEMALISVLLKETMSKPIESQKEDW